jgi:hypothetical protein
MWISKGGSHVHCHPVDGLGTRLYPCGIANGYCRRPFTVGLQTQAHQTQPEVPRPVMRGGCAPLTSPYPPGSSWRDLKRRNNTDFSRVPSRLAHHARPIR